MGGRHDSDNFLNVRFYLFDWQTKTSVRDEYRKAIDTVIGYVGQTFITHQLEDFSTIDHTSLQSCAGYEFGTDDFTNLADTASDVKIILTGDSTSSTSSWASPCVVDANGVNQVYMGRIHINTANIAVQSQAEQTADLMRLTFQVLGFHTSLYDYWKDENGV